MKILLIGSRGQLATDLVPVLSPEHEIVSADIEEVQVQDAASVDALVDAHNPDLIINCSAYHLVDLCETNLEITFAVNVFGVRNLANAARRHDIPMVHYSTDYVFSDGTAPHVETENPTPVSVYGVAKLASEKMLAATWRKHFVIRTCGLYGYVGSREKKTNFVESMINLARSGKPMKVVNDQTCTPTSTAELALATKNLISTEAYGLYHLSAAGACTWYEFAKAIFEFAGLTPDVAPVTSDAFQTAARRPTYSVMDNAAYRALGFPDMRHWRDALRDYVAGRTTHGRV